MIKHYRSFEELTDTATAYLTSLRYNLKMVYHYQREWRYVGSYMKKKGIQAYTPEIGAQYLKEAVGDTNLKDLPRSKRMRIRTVSSLSDFLTTGSIRKRKLSAPPEELDGQIGLAISRYIIEMAQLNGYSKSTIQSHKLYLSRFLKYLNDNNITSFDLFTPALMLDFAGSLSEYSIITRHFILLKTKQFLQYLHENGVLPVDCASIIPQGKYVRQPKLPSCYSPDEINQLLRSIDRSSAYGRRDYAMILIVVRLGLRCSDVANMKFCNIRWEQEKITLNQQKTKVLVELPLFQDVGNAIIDYMKYGRPQSDLPYVFLRLIPPYDNIDENALYGIMQKYLRLSGIKYDERRHGPHALRHSLATHLMEQKTPLPVISSVLGHVSTESTIGYLRVSIESLRKCALDVLPVQTDETQTGKEESK